MKRIPRKIWVAVLIAIIFQLVFDPLSSVQSLGEYFQARIFLPAAREKWKSQNITHYRFDIQGYFPLLCMFGGMIEVKDGVVIPGLINDIDMDPIMGLSPGFSGLENPPLCNDQNYTMPLLFDEIEFWMKDSPLSITQISFDPQYGFISSFKFGNPGGRGLLNPMVSDCCGGFTIEKFQVLDE